MDYDYRDFAVMLLCIIAFNTCDSCSCLATTTDDVSRNVSRGSDELVEIRKLLEEARDAKAPLPNED